MNKKLKIDVLANDGSPLGVTEKMMLGEDASRVGVGGAELAILTLMRGWHDAGHKVTFYNNPTHANGSAFRHLPIALFSPMEDRDILIVFRSPNKRAIRAKGKKIWLSTDQYTVGDFAEFSKKVDKIVTISQFHADHFRNAYGILDTVSIDLPIRTEEYDQSIEKIRNRLIFCSGPDRGLMVLADVYDNLKSQIPGLSLSITSDYRLWGASSPLNEQHIRRFMGKGGVTFIGAVPRATLIEEQLKAEIHAYPCTYSELFCYSVAECSVAGAFPISSDIGALSTTNMGMKILGDVNSSEWKNSFIETIVSTLGNPKLDDERKELQELAKKRFSLDRILKEWDEKIFYS